MCDGEQNHQVDEMLAFQDWCCGAAHSSERSQPFHLGIEHPRASHQPTRLTLTYLKIIMKMYYLNRGRKSTYSGMLTVEDLQ